MADPQWVRGTLSLHRIFEDAGIEVEVTYNAEKDRVEAVCHDIPPYIFPSNSWYVTEDLWNRGEVTPLLEQAVYYIREYLDE